MSPRASKRALLLLTVVLTRCAGQSLLQRLYELGSQSPYELFKASMEDVPMAVPEPDVACEAAAASTESPEIELAFPPLTSIYDGLSERVQEDLGVSMPQLALVVSCLFFAWSLGQHGGEWLAHRMHGAAAQGTAGPSASAGDGSAPVASSSSSSSVKAKEE